MEVLHFDKVDRENIKVVFTEDRLHRSSLTVPFFERDGEKALCIIGQNPSNANEVHADKTLRYLEQFVFQNLPEYSEIIMLNLYSRIDTKKDEITDLERDETKEKFFDHLEEYSDFLLVFGKSKNEGVYKFPDKATEAIDKLSGKNVFKIDIGANTSYPPHPGNPEILYRNYDCGVVSFP